jgi:hypothetical protein
LFIVRRLPEHRKWQPAAVYHSLFAEADDFGNVDLEDMEVFADLCLITDIADLQDVIARMLERRIITEFEPQLYHLVEWDLLYTYDERPRMAQSMTDRRKRIHKKMTGGSAAGLAAAAAGDPDVSDTDVADFSSSENDTKAENVATSPHFDKTGRNVDANREEKRDKKEKSRKKEKTHTQERESPPTPTACAGHSPDSGGTGAGLGPEEIRDEEIEPTEEPESTENKRTSTGEGTEGALTIERADTHEGFSTGDAIDSVVKQGVSERAPPPEECLAPRKALSEYFSRNNPMGYPNLDIEAGAIKLLSARMASLGTEKYNAEIVACQFVGAFRKLIDSSPYYKDMPCIPSMLLKPGTYSKVFTMVQRVLYPKGDMNVSWVESWEKTLSDVRKYRDSHDSEEEIGLTYEKYGIDPKDPARFQKLQAAKKGETGK